MSPPPSDQVGALDDRQATVDNHDVVATGQAFAQRGLAMRRDVDRVALLDEQALQHAGQLGVAIHQQHAGSAESWFGAYKIRRGRHAPELLDDRGSFDTIIAAQAAVDT